MKRMIRRIFSIDDYAILCIVPERDWSSRAVASQLKFIELTASDISAIEEVRPGYGRTALSYLNSGHRGIAIVVDGTIASMGWYWTNRYHKVTPVKGYFPLGPGDSYMHADWTLPSYRGRGFHQQLVILRCRMVLEECPESTIYTNISPNNSGSLRNYRELGFTETSSLRVWRLLRWSFSKSSGRSKGL